MAALEILINTPAPANLLRQGKLDQLENAMQAGGQFGMRTMDSAIQQLLDQRMITGKEAYKKAINKAKFELGKDAGGPAGRARRKRQLRRHPSRRQPGLSRPSLCL